MLGCDSSTSYRQSSQQAIAEQALGSVEIRRLMTIPGVDVTTAATLMAAIGDVSRFSSPRHLVGYLSLDPKLRQSGVAKSATVASPRRGRRRPARARRGGLVGRQSAEAAARLRRTHRARRGRHLAAVAVARKLAVLAWHLLSRGEDYAYQRPSVVRRKPRRLELKTGAPRAKRHAAGTAPLWGSRAQDDLERELARQAELAYRRLAADWQRTRPKDGAGATPGRAPSRPSERQAARQETAPPPAL